MNRPNAPPVEHIRFILAVMMTCGRNHCFLWPAVHCICIKSSKISGNEVRSAWMCSCVYEDQRWPLTSAQVTMMKLWPWRSADALGPLLTCWWRDRRASRTLTPTRPWPWSTSWTLWTGSGRWCSTSLWRQDTCTAGSWPPAPVRHSGSNLTKGC